MIMRNMRQVMTGLKNYLTITGEGDLKNMVKRASLNPKELDMVLEEVMQELIVKPLSRHLHCLMIQHHSSHLADRIRMMQDIEADDVIDDSLVSQMKECQSKMRESPYSVADKMTCIQSMVDMVRTCLKPQTCDMSNTHDMVGLLSRLIVGTDWTEAGMEVNYIWGLINTSNLRYTSGLNLAGGHVNDEINISSLCNFRSRWSLCLVSCAVASVMSGEDPLILTIRADKLTSHVQNLTSYIQHLTSNGQHLTSDVLQVPCKPDMIVGDVLSMLDLKKNVVLVSRHQTNGKIIIYHNKIHIYVFLFLNMMLN